MNVSCQSVIEHRKNSAQDLKSEIVELAKRMGADKVGFAARQRFDDAPESGDISYVLTGAQTAISLVMALDREAIRAYLGKQDQLRLNANVEAVYLRLEEIATAVQDLLRKRGYETSDLFPNFEYRDGQPLLAMVPKLSHKYVGVAAGTGWIGWSGNLMTPEYGSAVILTSVVTSAVFESDPMLEDNQCDSCRLCASTCPSMYMSKKASQSVTLGGKQHNYSRINGNIRCIVSCGGANGVAKPDAKWSTWSPKVLQLPGEEASEEEFRAACQDYIDNKLEDGFDKKYLNTLINTNFPGVKSREEFDTVCSGMRSMSCGNCLYICWGDMEDRRTNYRLILKSGRVVQEHQDIKILNDYNKEEPIKIIDPESITLVSPLSSQSLRQ